MDIEVGGRGLKWLIEATIVRWQTAELRTFEKLF